VRFGPEDYFALMCVAFVTGVGDLSAIHRSAA
jgi:hypothetical protein